MFKRHQSQIDRSRRLVLRKEGLFARGSGLEIVRHWTGGKHSELATPDVEFLCLMVIEYSLGSITSVRCSEKWAPADPLLTDWRDRRASSLLHFFRDVSREKSLAARKDGCVHRLSKSVHFFIHTMQNIYRQFVFENKNKEKKSRKTLKSHKKGSYVCGVQSSKGSLFGLTLDTLQHKYHVSFLVSPSYHLLLSFVKGHPISARSE